MICDLIMVGVDNIEDAINVACWGTLGEDGKSPLRYVRLKDCTTDHLQAILRTQRHVQSSDYGRIIQEILRRRGEEPERYQYE